MQELQKKEEKKRMKEEEKERKRIEREERKKAKEAAKMIGTEITKKHSFIRNLQTYLIVCTVCMHWYACSL